MIGPYIAAIGVLLLLCLVLGGLLYSHMKMEREQRERRALERHHDNLSGRLGAAIKAAPDGEWHIHDVHTLKCLLGTMIHHSRP